MRAADSKLRAEIWSDGDGDDQDGAHDSGRRPLASGGALDALMDAAAYEASLEG